MLAKFSSSLGCVVRKCSFVAQFKAANFDISTKTRSELNILDIACMIYRLKGDMKFYKHILVNELDKLFPSKTDLSG